MAQTELEALRAEAFDLEQEIVRLTAQADEWRFWGKDLTNNAHTPGGAINPGTVKKLGVKWAYKTDTDANCAAVNCSVTATPTVMDGVVYFPDWAGNLHAVDVRETTIVHTRSCLTNPATAARSRTGAREHRRT